MATNVVLAEAQSPPVASFTYTPKTPLFNQTIIFNASASYDSDRHIISYKWTLGDGNTTTVTYPILTHAYAAEGTYNVTLTVTDDDNLTHTASKMITVYTFIYIHDVAIVSVTPFATVVPQGQILNITVVARNEGTAVDTFNVTAYYDGVSIGTKPVNSLLPNTEVTLSFSWNTTGITFGNYTISAQASVVPDEAETADNTVIDGTVKVVIPGDVNANGIVDMKDIFQLILHFMHGIGDPRYLPNLDINCDDIIDMRDIFIAIIYFIRQA